MFSMPLHKTGFRVKKKTKFLIINYYCGILARKRLQFMYSECVEQVFLAWMRDNNLGRLSYGFLGKRCCCITSEMLCSKNCFTSDFTLMYCLVMFSAFLNTVFRIAEKITKHYRICFIIFAGFRFL